MNDTVDPFASESSPVIAETYRIENGVARGGFSTIYRATHIEMDRPVALKILKVDDDVDAGVLERFSQEARLTCQINHPNVVTIYEFGQDERGLLYIAMEWLPGDSLNTHLDEHGALEAEEVARFGSEIAEGLAAAHEHAILHRDLKPSNIMLARLATGDLHAKVLDFGIAKALDPPLEDQLRITQEGMFVGTPRYAAPEQIQGGELAPRTDIYGVGLLLWESIVGDPAVPTVDFQECCAHHLSNDPWELPHDVDCPEPLTDVIETCLRKDPDERYQSCEELADALRDVQAQLTLATPATAAAPSASSWSGRWTRVVFGVLTALAVLALFAYPRLLSFDADYSDRRRPPAANGALVETTDGLVTQLERRGWKVDGPPDEADAGPFTVTVASDKSQVTFETFDGSPDEISSPKVEVPFPAFHLVVTTGGEAPGRMFYRLNADLFQLRYATARNGK